MFSASEGIRSLTHRALHSQTPTIALTMSLPHFYGEVYAYGQVAPIRVPRRLLCSLRYCFSHL